MDSNNGNGSGGFDRLKNLLPYIAVPIILVLIIGFFTRNNNAGAKDSKLEYYQVITLFENEQVSECSLNFSSGVLTFKLVDDSKTTYTYTVPDVSLFLSDVHQSLVQYNIAHPDNKIKFDYKAGSGNSWWISLLPSLIMTLLLVGIMFYAMRRMNQSMMGEQNRAFNFGKARVKMEKDEKRKTTFDDVAGCDEEKEELAEIVEFLKNPDHFSALGARIPRGVLLVGRPGTGKTLLARAVAGEASVPFFSISGSDFVEMYVGVGASRVRDLFDKAKKNAPSIVFIDEIDAVGRHRGAGMGGGHDEREQTLNQMLVEMDGFGVNDGVIVMAATNRPDILDPALLRPGRFDRQVTVSLPDVNGREAILRVHAKNKSLGPDVRLEEIAKSTVGFTGADLENLLNEAALLAARKGYRAVTQTEIDEAVLKVIMGPEKRSHKISDKDKHLTAVHESGHAVATFFLGGQDPVKEVSIIPRGLAGGYTLSVPEHDEDYVTKKQMYDDIVILLGGRIAESLVLGDISTGASNDIQRATSLARDMVTKYGMSDKLGPITFGSQNEEVFLGKDYGTVRNYSENIASEIDEEVNRIVSTCYAKCEELLKTNMNKLLELSGFLEQHEKIDGDRFAELMQAEPALI
ncbi:MAG: ATP-dependent zinc metalloprotease FtsH [Clostridia bacterium]|nr:ATP-dependent zinc metalloprotease FtsH [Clostridia bacterium]